MLVGVASMHCACLAQVHHRDLPATSPRPPAMARAKCLIAPDVCQGVVHECLPVVIGLVKEDADNFLRRTEKFLKAVAGVTDRLNITVVEKALKHEHRDVPKQDIAQIAKRLVFHFSDLHQRSKDQVDFSRMQEGPERNVCQIFKQRLFRTRANDLL